MQLAIQNIDIAAAVASEIAKTGKCDKAAVLQHAETFQQNIRVGFSAQVLPACLLLMCRIESGRAQEVANLVLPVLKAIPEPIPSEANPYSAQAEADAQRIKLQFLLEHTRKMSSIAADHLHG